MSLDIIGSSDGFHFYAQNKNKIHLTGSELTFNQGIKLKYELPFQPTVDYKVRVKRNGITLVEYKSQKSEYLPKQKGTYRLEVLVKPQIPLPKDKLWIPWIITNPIYLN
jgi:hypothetical protein